MKLDIRIPISPEPYFYRQVEYLWRAFNAAGGVGARARFVVTVGEDCEPFDLVERNPWSRDRVEWRWTDREKFRRLSYGATALDRWEHGTDADVVLLLDADTLLINPIDDIVQALAETPAIAGVMAHVPPFVGLAPQTGWDEVFAAVGRSVPPDRFQHSGWGGMLADHRHRFGPAYYNFGAVFVPGSLLLKLGAEYERWMASALTAPIHRWFYGQLALTFAIYELQLPRIALGLRYNFPNDVWADHKMSSELSDIRILHYLREDVIGTRRETWGSDKNFAAFLARKDLTGSNEVLRATAALLRAKFGS
jgi:hypothetical protein